MNFLKELSATTAKPKLIPLSKQPERRLLSVFMALLEISPEIRARFLQICGYGAGRTCNTQSFMEVGYSNSKYTDVRPDGLLYCERGTNTWSAFIEAKARTSKIRSEQILDYIELAAALGVDSVITISNEFSLTPEELPYHLPQNRLRKRALYHFAWADIRTFLERVKVEVAFDPIELALLDQCLEFFWHDESGIATFDKMPQDWPKFVDSARTGVGFSAKTPGITDIVHAWQQERRDLCSKLGHQLQQPVELRHPAGARATPDERLKHDRSLLADKYELSARYQFRNSKNELVVTADLVNRKMTWVLSIQPPENKKAKATVGWLIERGGVLDMRPLDMLLYWKGRQKATSMSFEDMVSEPEIAWKGQKDQPRKIQIVTAMQNSTDFRSAKKFISSLEEKTQALVGKAQSTGWL